MSRDGTSAGHDEPRSENGPGDATGSDALLRELEDADRAVRDAEAAIEEVGEERLRRLRDRHDRFQTLLDRYEDDAVGSGRETFASYVEFQGELDRFQDDVPSDLPASDALDEACEVLDRRRLDASDFERAREALAPVRDYLERLDARTTAERRYRDARRALVARRDEVADRIAELESTLEFADVDLDQPVDELRDPIEAYDEAVAEAFRSFVHDAPAREVLDVLETAGRYPLVPVSPPPGDMVRYLREAAVREEPIRTLLEYADFSRSKLSHYVDDPGAFRVNVAGNRTYLERLDATPFRIGWPPSPAEELRFRGRELVPVVDRFAPADVLACLHDVRDLTYDPAFGRLRDVAIAREALDAETRERLRSGAVERELAERREELDRLRDALSEYPDR